MWLWIVIGLEAFFALSVVLGLALAAMLATISRAITELHDEAFEARAWSVEPPTRRRRRRQLQGLTAHALPELESRRHA